MIKIIALCELTNPEVPRTIRLYYTLHKFVSSLRILIITVFKSA